MAAYHIQQAAEKHIKAVLIHKGIAPPKTHDLEQLIVLVPLVPPSDLVLAAASATSSYAWITRYPGDATFSQREIEEAERDLQIIKRWTLAAISDSE